MSAGSSLALQLIGKSDLITVVDPETTFWQYSFQTHTPFQIEPKRFEFAGLPEYGRLNTCDLKRTADFWKQIYLCLHIDKLDLGNGGARFVEDVGRAMIESVVLEIGNISFDVKQGEILHIEEELDTLEENHYGRLTGKTQNVAELIDWAKREQFLMVPLTFWWFKVPYPIVAAFLTEPKIKLRLKKKEDLIVTTGAPYVPTAADAKILDGYVHIECVLLEEGERNFVADSQNVYVIEQTQLETKTLTTGATSQKIQFQVNHPVREIILVARSNSNTTAKNYFNFSGQETGVFQGELFKSLSLKINGNERWEPQNPLYHRIIQPKQYHTRVPKKHIHAYSFALTPETPNPNGSINFSRIENASLEITFTSALTENFDLFIYVKNHNSASIEKGVTRMAFAS
jgi:hypothetical protein